VSGNLKYKRHRRQGRADQAFVEIDGTRRYLGPYDSQESWARYKRLIAGDTGPSEAFGITVVEVVAAYWEHAKVP